MNRVLAVQSLNRVREMFLAGRLGAADTDSCVYHQVGGEKRVERFCAVGCLFTAEQLADIKKHGMNSGVGIQELAEQFGKRNLEAVTGLKIGDLENLQSSHDDMTSDDEVKRAFRAGKVNADTQRFLDDVDALIKAYK